MSHRPSQWLFQATAGLVLALAPSLPAWAGDSSWLAIASGDYHTCALGNAGNVYCWGDNSEGELGNPSVPVQVPGASHSNVPVMVQGLPAPAIAVAAGDSNSCALLSTGAVYCWGYNKNGQLGNASASPGANNIPMLVQGLPAAATSVAIDNDHACASLATGAVACWGTNFDPYELGNASIPKGATVLPTVVPGVVRASSVSVGGQSTCAVVRAAYTTRGRPFPTGPQCWGDNAVGQGGQAQLGSILPTNDNNVPWDITSISVSGVGFTCAISQSEGALCWGYDSPAGNLGDNLACQKASGFCSLPQQVQFGISRGSSPTSISANGSTCAAYANGTYGAGTVYCWGLNVEGEIGLPPYNPEFVTAAFGVQVGAQATAVSSGSDHACAIVNQGSNISCWGYNSSGQLGNGSFVSSYLPVTVQ